jgi:hypothetical protein
MRKIKMKKINEKKLCSQIEKFKNVIESIMVTNEKTCFFSAFYFGKIDFGHF